MLTLPFDCNIRFQSDTVPDYGVSCLIQKYSLKLYPSQLEILHCTLIKRLCTVKICQRDGCHRWTSSAELLPLGIMMLCFERGFLGPTLSFRDCSWCEEEQIYHVDETVSWTRAFDSVVLAGQAMSRLFSSSWQTALWNTVLHRFIHPARVFTSSSEIESVHPTSITIWLAGASRRVQLTALFLGSFCCWTTSA